MEVCPLNNRTRALKTGGLLALIGPLPGYFVFAFRNFLAVGNAGEALRLFVYFYAAAILLFGWYCFIIGVIGALLHDKLNALGVPSSARAGAVVMLGAAAAVPIVLMEGSATRGMGIAAMVSAGFWIAAYLALAAREGANQKP